MKFEKIDHIHITVSNLERAVEVLERLMGTRFQDFGSSAELGFRAAMDPLGISLTVPTSDDSPIAEYIRRRGEGVQSLALKVRDLDTAVNHWQK